MINQSAALLHDKKMRCVVLSYCGFKIKCAVLLEKAGVGEPNL